MMTKSVYKYSLILFLFSTGLVACGSAFNNKISLEKKKFNSKTIYVSEDWKQNVVELDSSNLRSNYAIKGNNLYLRLLVDNHSYINITYIVVKNFKGAVQDISAFTFDTSIHPGTMKYLSKVKLFKTDKKGSDLIVSMRLKSLKINTLLTPHIKSILMEVNNISFKKIDSLSLLKSIDNSWEYAKSIRESEFKAY